MRTSAPVTGRARLFACAAWLAAMLIGCWARDALGTTITIVNLDGAGEGFNDPTPVSAVGGNPGTTLGQQRLNVFNRAAELWSARLISSVPIRVGAHFDPLPCSTSSGVLGSASPVSIFRDFSGAPLAATYYVGALANALAGSDLNPAANDIDATFNSNVGQTGCLSSSSWYYGLDGKAPVNSINLLDTVMHELAHGFGFISTVDLVTGAKLNGADDAYCADLEDHTTGKRYPAMTDAERVTASRNTGNLHWVGTNVIGLSTILSSGRSSGGHVQMYAPNPQEAGSSVSHFSNALFPDELMEPFAAPVSDARLTLELLKDLGWQATPFRPNVVTNGAVLVAEYCAPTNNAIDPGETVVVALSLKNIGPSAATNVVATLLASGGVARPGAAQTFGPLAASGPAQTRNFAFTAGGSCGGTLVLTLQLQDGPDDLGTVSFSFPLGGNVGFTNSTRITIPSSGAASPYPSAITVSGLPPGTPPPKVTLLGLSHANPDDLDVLLVGPQGQTVLLMSDAGGGNSLSSVNLSFADDAAAPLPDSGAIISGTYQPTDYVSGDVLPAGAPAGPYGASLSVFQNTDLNGTWNLFVFDDSPPRSGSIAGGWALNFPRCCTSSSPELAMAGGAARYVENSAPVLLDPTAIASDADSGTFAGGSLSVTFSTNGTEDDRLGLRDQGSGPGQIGLSQGTILYGGVPIGTVSGLGNSLSPLRCEFSGPTATLEAVQAVARNLTFSNVSDGPSPLSRTVQLILVDDTGLTNDVPSTQTVTVIPVNDAPTLAANVHPALSPILEDLPAGSNTGTLVSTLLAGATADPDPGSVRGMAVTAVANVGGTWQFSTNGGAAWRALGPASEGNARLVPEGPGSLIRFFPNPNFFGTASFTFRAWDQTVGVAGGLGNATSNGGTNAFSVASTSASIVVSPVNDSPSLAPIGSVTLNEDAGTQTIALTGITSGASNESQLLALTVSSGNPLLVPTPTIAYTSPGTTGSLQFTPVAGAHGLAVIVVTVTDNGGTADGGINTASQSFQVSILASNHPPVLAPVQDLTLLEGISLLLTNRATDADVPSDQLTFSLDPGTPAGAAIDPVTGVLQWMPGAADLGTTNLFTVRVTDDGQPSLSDVRSFRVSVLPRSIRLRLVREGGLVSLSWNSQPGSLYVVQYKSALEEPDWIPLSDPIPASGSSASTEDTLAEGSQRFYRVLLVP